jgi:hypothetical protein
VLPLSGSNTNASQTAQPENNATAQAASTVKSAVANPTTAAAVVGTVATNKLANPAIAKLPTGADDDDDDDDHGRDHDDDDDDDDEEGDDD